LTHRFRPRLAALAFAAFAGACEAGSPLETGPGRVSLEEALAELAVPALQPAMTTFTGVGPSPAIAPSTCAYDGASESFVCAPVPANGLTLARSFTLVSAAGAKQSAFDRGTTSWLRESSTIAGTVVQGGGVTTTVDGEQELTLTGLLTGRHTISGSSTKRLATFTDAGTGGQPVLGTVTTKMKNVVLPVAPPGGPVAWPLSGPGPMVSGVVVVFTGTSIVEVAITVRGTTRACHANMMIQGLGCPF
jgi:hypothetical protein